MDWELYRKCPVCFAELGKPCRTLQGSVVNGAQVTVASEIVRERPHSRRELRAAAARDAQFGRVIGR